MDVFEIFAKLSLDDSGFESGLSKAKGLVSSVGGAAMKGVKVVAGAVTAATGAMAAATTALAKSAIDSYADYEQLTGGVETLYKDSYDKIAQYAQDAYKTAGMSANEYMDMSIKTGAAMIASVGGDTEKAAELMNTSITDMADNVNKMGTNMEDVQNAYRGFSRGNFTMLDNLALGFSGTKEGMQELLAQAEAISGVKYDISSYGDIVQAIHVVQEEMGIAGTTAKEASETISGSFGMMQKAWENLVTGFADPDADLDSLFDELISSAEVFGDNVMPVVERTLQNVSRGIEIFVPKALEKLPEFFGNVGPSILNTLSTIFSTVMNTIPKLIYGALPTILNAISSVSLDIASGLPNILQAVFGSAVAVIRRLIKVISDELSNGDSLFSGFGEVFENIVSQINELLPQIVQLGAQLIVMLSNGISQAIPELIPAIISTLDAIVSAIIDNAPALLSAGLQIITTLASSISENIGNFTDTAISIIESLLSLIIENIPTLIEAGLEIILSLADAIIENLPKLLEAGVEIISEILTAVSENLPLLIDAGMQILEFLMQAIIDNLPQLIEIGLSLMMQIIQAITENLPLLVNGAIQLLLGLTNFIIENLPLIIDAGIQILMAIVDAIVDTLPTLIDQIIEIVFAIADTIIDNLDTIIEAGFKILLAVVSGIVKTLPKIIDAGAKIIKSLISGVDSIKSQLFQKFTDIVNKIREKVAALPEKMLTYGVQIIMQLAQGIANTVSSITSAMSSIGTTIYNGIKGTIDKAKEWGTHLIQNFISGLNEAWKNNPINKIAQGIADKLAHSHPKEGPLADDYTWMPDMMDLFTEGIKSKQGQLFKTIDDTFNFGERVTIPTESAFGISSTTSYGVPEKNVTVILQIDKTQLGKTVFKLNNEESRRIGVNLVNA